VLVALASAIATSPIPREQKQTVLLQQQAEAEAGRQMLSDSKQTELYARSADELTNNDVDYALLSGSSSSGSGSGGASNTTVPTAQQIVDYHIVLWTSVFLVLIVVAAIYAIMAMENRRDPLLYSQLNVPTDKKKR